MNIPTIHFTQSEFDCLPVSESGAYDQSICRYLSKTGQWLYINKDDREVPCAVIKISDKLPSGKVVTQDFESPEAALEEARRWFVVKDEERAPTAAILREPKTRPPVVAKRPPTKGAFGKPKRR